MNTKTQNQITTEQITTEQIKTKTIITTLNLFIIMGILAITQCIIMLGGKYFCETILADPKQDLPFVY